MPDPTPDPPVVTSPPPAEQPVRQPPDPRDTLRELAREFLRTRDRRLLFEYLRTRGHVSR